MSVPTPDLAADRHLLVAVHDYYGSVDVRYAAECECGHVVRRPRRYRALAAHVDHRNEMTRVTS